jgi:hypothetical protein
MNEKIFEHWKTVLLTLQKAEEKIQQTQGYTSEVETLRMLKELINEQIINENPDHTTR